MVGKFIGISTTCRIAPYNVQEGIVFTFYFNINLEFCLFPIVLSVLLFMCSYIFFSLQMASVSVKHASVFKTKMAFKVTITSNYIFIYTEYEPLNISYF